MAFLLHIATALVALSGLLLSVISASAQAPEWALYNTRNSGLPENQIQAIAIGENNAVWLGTSEGVVRFDGVNWMVYNAANSGLPGNYVSSIKVDRRGKVWVGTTWGVGCFDGVNWTAYTAGNSPLPSNDVSTITADAQGRVWIGTAKGMAVVDGSQWTVYNEENSPILDNIVRSIAIDSTGTVWIGTFDTFNFNGHLLRYDGTTWKRYHLAAYGLTSSFPDVLAVDEDNVVWLGTKGTTGGALVKIINGEWVVTTDRPGPSSAAMQAIAMERGSKWMSTAAGLLHHDGKNWTVYDKSNSQLPDDIGMALAVDGRGNTWIGTLAHGVAVYRKGGIVTSAEPQWEEPKAPALSGNFPNPCAAATSIRYRLDAADVVSLRVCDVFGKEIAVLVNEYKPAGEHIVAFDAASLPDGAYIYTLRTANRTESRVMVRAR